jgi:primosomal protein N' (replication factor Y)
MPSFAKLLFDIPVDREWSYLVPDSLEASIAPGIRVRAPLGRRVATGYVVAVSDEAPALSASSLKSIEKAIDAEPLFGESEISLARWIAKRYFCSAGEALAAMLPGARREAEPLGLGGDVPPPRCVQRSDEQESALESILGAEPGSFHYLYGITGSGKTEVFLSAAEGALSRGKSVIYLVPEITLTSQVIEAVTARLSRHTGGRIAVLHSGIAPSRRLADWRACFKGEVRIAIGARSAVFAPLKDLGLIIVDEEHEGSYKSGQNPRYHARQVAMRRCVDSGAVLVMGSATPSIEAWQLVRDGGALRQSSASGQASAKPLGGNPREGGSLVLHKLTRRLAGGSMPEIRVIDMGGASGCFSDELVEAIRESKALRRQSILFLNRRGFNHFFRCKSCGYEMTCKRCSVGLTLHKAQGRMVCHYCGYTTKPPTICPECGSLDSGYAGFGTEFVEQEAARLFPGLSIARLDADSARRKGEAERTLKAFKGGEIDVLLGTQMVAKGLNFPSLRLVGVLMADSALSLPDFRAAERCFGLITQVAGRAGRYFPDGKVIVQTYRPDADAIASACSGDLEGFYARELAMRRELGFPPFSRLIRVVARSKNQAEARSTASAIGGAVVKALSGAGEVLGPSDCAISQIAEQHRAQVLLRGPSLEGLARALRSALSSIAPPSSTKLEIDVDPVSLL